MRKFALIIYLYKSESADQLCYHAQAYQHPCILLHRLKSQFLLQNIDSCQKSSKWQLIFLQAGSYTILANQNIYIMMPLFKSAFLCIFSFGKRTPGCARRASECLILEPSEMIVVSYCFIIYKKICHYENISVQLTEIFFLL